VPGSDSVSDYPDPVLELQLHEAYGENLTSISDDQYNRVPGITTRLKFSLIVTQLVLNVEQGKAECTTVRVTSKRTAGSSSRALNRLT
jgi:hypothetical protein